MRLIHARDVAAYILFVVVATCAMPRAATAQDTPDGQPLLVRSGTFPTREGVLAQGARVGEVAFTADLDGDSRPDELWVARGGEDSTETALVIALHGESGWTAEQVVHGSEAEHQVIRWMAPLTVGGQTVLVSEENAVDVDCRGREAAQHLCQPNTLRYTLRTLGPTHRSEVRYVSPEAGESGACDFVLGGEGTLVQRSLRGTSHRRANGAAPVTWTPTRYRVLTARSPSGPFTPGEWSRQPPPGNTPPPPAIHGEP